MYVYIIYIVNPPLDTTIIIKNVKICMMYAINFNFKTTDFYVASTKRVFVLIICSEYWYKITS